MLKHTNQTHKYNPYITYAFLSYPTKSFLLFFLFFSYLNYHQLNNVIFLKILQKEGCETIYNILRINLKRFKRFLFKYQDYTVTKLL